VGAYAFAVVQGRGEAAAQTTNWEGRRCGARGEERERWIWFGVVYICLLRLFLTVES
jgi:hypothetical protein